MNSIKVGKPGDFHVHLRDNGMKQLVTPLVRQGGISVCLVMPNLDPPLTSPDDVMRYYTSLKEIAPTTHFLTSLYLSPAVQPTTIVEAYHKGITSVKCYPAGVTTNSALGVSSYDQFFPTFAEMERVGMVLNLHGECPSGGDITVLNAEEQFLPFLRLLQDRFPNLRIVLEHCTTAAAVRTVMECGPTVAATITAHHLYLTVDSWGGNSDYFCKPVAKLPSDRQALIDAATSGNPKFFFGSDSAPHPVASKEKSKGAAAGVFTQAYALPLVAEIFEQAGALDKIEGFVSTFGKKFYNIHDEDLDGSVVTLVRKPQVVPKTISGHGVDVVPFKAGETLNWSVEWSK